MATKEERQQLEAMRVELARHGLKQCSVCRLAKPRDAFSQRKATKSDGLSYKCRDCQREFATNWRAKNPDAFRKWAEPRKDELAERNRNWMQANKRRRAEYMTRWDKENRLQRRANHAHWLATKRRATPAWADLSEIRRFYERADELSKMTGVPHEVDHYYPLRGKLVCGLHCEANLQILTQAENISKLNRMPEEWAAKRAREAMTA